jgi:membrane associated rhomboid family serine protease
MDTDNRGIHLHPDTTDQPDTPGMITGTREYLQTCSLVLNSVGIRHSIDQNHSILTVPAPYAKAAERQLSLYFKENKGWPERPEPANIPSSTETPPTLVMIGGLAIFYLVTGPWADKTFWFESGAVHSQAILEQGEWWRLITALTLHADQVHLLGNCVIGGFLVHMLCKTIGPGLGWLSLITCGALGNLLNIIVRDQAHLSVGFSTSIFAAIGLFSGLQILTRRRTKLREILVPLGAGAGLLAMLGAEGERTDLGAHFFGFACGVVVGFVMNRFDLQKIIDNHQLQEKLFVLTLLIIVISWMAA